MQLSRNMRGHEIKRTRLRIRLDHLQQRMRTASTVVRQKRDTQFDDSVLRGL